MENIGTGEVILALIGVISTTAIVNAAFTRWLMGRASRSEDDARKLRDERIQELVTARNALEVEIGQLRERIKVLEPLQLEVGRLRDHVDELKSELESTREAMDERDRKITTLQGAVEELGNEKARLERYARELEDNNKRLTAQKDALIEALKAVGADYATLKENAKSKDNPEEEDEVGNHP